MQSRKELKTWNFWESLGMALQLKYNCFEKEIEFFLYVYKFRSVKVIELIFTYTVSKFMVISFNLNRKWLKGPDTNGKTV